MKIHVITTSIDEIRFKKYQKMIILDHIYVTK